MTREEAIDVLKHNYPSACFTDLCEAVDMAIEALKVEPKRGRWQTWYHGGFQFSYTCRACGFPSNDEYDYCPNCGAQMEVQE